MGFLSSRWLAKVYGSLVLALVAAQPSAQSPAQPAPPTPPASAALVPSLVKTEGENLAVVIRFTIEPHWHIYWSNPGDSGSPTRVKLTLPSGWESGPLQYPRPRVLGTDEDRAYGYEKSVDLILPITKRPAQLPEKVHVTAAVEWLVCKQSCLFGQAQLVGDLATSAPNKAVPQAAERRANLPRKLPEGAAAKVTGTGASRALEVSLPIDAAPNGVALFIPDDVPGVALTEGVGPFKPTKTEKTLRWRIPFEFQMENATDGEPRVRGLVLVGTDPEDPCFQVDLALSPLPAR